MTNDKAKLIMMIGELNGRGIKLLFRVARRLIGYEKYRKKKRGAK